MKKSQTIPGAVTLLFILVPLLAHLEKNNNHLDYTNHEYAKNLLSTLEPYSIFMTEGGDNQVFATAYSQMAEQLRPDVRAYDQKGNVFYRIYGDFRYISVVEADIKRDVVDYEIFSRGRPVYLTWRRSPDVAVCGDWFLKRSGMLFRIVPLKYRILEDLGADLEITIEEAHRCIEKYYADETILKKKQANLKAMDWYRPAIFGQGNVRLHFISEEEFSRLQRAVPAYMEWLKGSLARNITPQFTLALLRELEAEGYLRITGNRVVFVRDIAQPFAGDYWEGYSFTYKNVPHAIQWNYLAREIFTNYNFYYAEYCRWMLERLRRRQAHYERKIQELGPSPELAGALDKTRAEIDRFAQLEAESYQSAAYFGYDMGAIFHNLGAIQAQRGQLDEAVGYFRQGIVADKYSYQTVSSYIMLRLRQANERMDPVFEEETLRESEQIVQAALRNLRKTYAADDESLRKDQTARILDNLDQGWLAPRKNYPLGIILQYKQILDNKPEDPSIQKQLASIIYYQRRDPELLVRIFETMHTSKWNNEMVVYIYGVSIQDTGELEASIAIFERLRREKPLFFLSVWRLAQIHEILLQDETKALRYYEELLRIPEAAVRALYPDLTKAFTDSVQMAEKYIAKARQSAAR
ncbi:MAG: hypothetical protein LBC99_09800 [Spirochaetota bacterium]|jgi:hypothetical protein|nr:hypothetical protein [Spirochaetota bacterium]